VIKFYDIVCMLSECHYIRGSHTDLKFKDGLEIFKTQKVLELFLKMRRPW